jgi:cytochrome c oxidase subunit 1
VDDRDAAEAPQLRRDPDDHGRDEFWHRKYAESEQGIPVAVPVGASVDHDEHDGDAGHIHMPDPSLWPAIHTLGVLPLGYGLVYANWC